MARKKRSADSVEADFGPGVAPPEGPAPRAGGPFPGLACGGEGCLLRPAADLVGKFTLSLAGKAALGRAAFSGIEFMKALRDFLDEEIALAERAGGARGDAPRYAKIKVE
jgi:hypothetical protein